MRSRAAKPPHLTIWREWDALPRLLKATNKPGGKRGPCRYLEIVLQDDDLELRRLIRLVAELRFFLDGRERGGQPTRVRMATGSAQGAGARVRPICRSKS